MADTIVEGEIKAFVKERDQMLLACDVDRMMAFHAKHNPDSPGFSSREVAETALHKARTGVLTLPMEERLKSKRWLRERGYSSMDDGDLVDA
jgi:hypothetical protein